MYDTTTLQNACMSITPTASDSEFSWSEWNLTTLDQVKQMPSA